MDCGNGKKKSSNLQLKAVSIEFISAHPMMRRITGTKETPAQSTPKLNYFSLFISISISLALGKPSHADRA